MNPVYNINIERAVLSSFLFCEDLFETKNILKSKDFYLPAHQKIYAAMIKLYDEDMPIDEEFLRKRLDKKEVDDNHLIEILSVNPITNIKAYVTEIKESSIKRELVTLSTTIKKVALEEELKADEAISRVESELFKITDTNASSNFRDLSEIVNSFNQKFIASAQGEAYEFKTGITSFDNQIGGFNRGDFIVIGARPSMGKTALALQIALHNIALGKGVVFDELEMPAEQLILRSIAHLNQENISDLKKGEVKNFDKYHETLKYLQTNNNFVLHDKLLSFKQLKSKMLKIKRDRDKKGLDTSIWIIDHVGYVNSDVRFKREELTAGSKMFKQLAKELDITIIALSQLNRDLKGRRGFRPMLSDLKESGSLEEDCDMAIFPHRDSYYEKAEKNEIEPAVNPANILILKNRNGRTGAVNCDFNGSTNSFGFYPEIEVTSYTNDSTDFAVEVPEI